MVVTIANDPAQEVAKLVFVSDVVKIPTGNPNEPVNIFSCLQLSLKKHIKNGPVQEQSILWVKNMNLFTR